MKHLSGKLGGMEKTSRRSQPHGLSASRSDVGKGRRS